MNVISSDIPGLEWAHEIPSVSFFNNGDIMGLYELLKNSLDGYSLVSKECVGISRAKIAGSYSTEAWARKIVNIYNL